MPKYYRGRDDVSPRSADDSRCDICENRITRERQARNAKYCSPQCYRKAKYKQRLSKDGEQRRDKIWQDRIRNHDDA